MLVQAASVSMDIYRLNNNSIRCQHLLSYSSKNRSMLRIISSFSLRDRVMKNGERLRLIRKRSMVSSFSSRWPNSNKNLNPQNQTLEEGEEVVYSLIKSPNRNLLSSFSSNKYNFSRTESLIINSYLNSKISTLHHRFPSMGSLSNLPINLTCPSSSLEVTHKEILTLK
jgi:hypothetical protein